MKKVVSSAERSLKRSFANNTDNIGLKMIKCQIKCRMLTKIKSALMLFQENKTVFSFRSFFVGFLSILRAKHEQESQVYCELKEFGR